MKKLALIAFHKNERTLEAIQCILEWAQNKDCELFFHPELPQFTEAENLPTYRHSLEEIRVKAGWAISIGGDGTFLTSARLFAGLGTPIFGVHTGTTGFLTDFSPENFIEGLDQVFKGNGATQSKLMLDVSLHRDKTSLRKNFALNEILIKPTQSQGMVELSVDINGEHLTDYLADSLLISTPTGSTAYNLSAGGPILHPTCEVVILTAINPPSLSVRPLVIPATAKITITSSNNQSNSIVLDGRVVKTLSVDETLEITRSHMETKVFKSEHYGFVDALKDKLGWNGHYRYTPGMEE